MKRSAFMVIFCIINVFPTINQGVTAGGPGEDEEEKKHNVDDGHLLPRSITDRCNYPGLARVARVAQLVRIVAPRLAVNGQRIYTGFGHSP